MIGSLYPPPLLVGHLSVPVQVPGVEGGLVRVPVARVNVSVILLMFPYQQHSLIHLTYNTSPGLWPGESQTSEVSVLSPLFPAHLEGKTSCSAMSVAVKPEQFGVSREGLFSSPSGPVEFAPGLERRVLLGSWPVVVQCWVCVGQPGRSQTGVG